MKLNLKNCKLCPHNCGIDRTDKKVGFCGCTDEIKIALSSIYKFEEPCISGECGSGAVFFSCCNLRCVYCQNYEISQNKQGKCVTIDELADIFIKLQEKGANNINLVTPTMYALQIKEAIIIARNKGLVLPIIYNSSGYEKIEVLKELDGYIDIYLPDFKYANNEIAFKYSNISQYYETTSKAILQMYSQVGNPKFSDKGLITKGLIIRHLILPNNIKNTKEVLRWIKDNIGQEAYISIMAQYFPTNRAFEFEEINRKINKRELRSVENYIYELNLNNGYIQELGKHEQEYVPKFEI